MKKIFTLLAFLTILGASAQQDTKSPDYTIIEKNIKDKASPYYYSTLLNRFNQADTSMTLEERRHLYYGYTFSTSQYDVASLEAVSSNLREVLQKADPTKADMENVIDLSSKILEVSPFSITVKEYRLYCLKELGRFDEAKKERAQTDMIIDAILSSGDGTTKQNSIHVINTGNEYEMVSVMGFEPIDNEFGINDKYDYLTLNKNSYNLPGLYFEVASTRKLVTGI